MKKLIVALMALVLIGAGLLSTTGAEGPTVDLQVGSNMIGIPVLEPSSWGDAILVSTNGTTMTVEEAVAANVLNRYVHYYDATQGGYTMEQVALYNPYIPVSTIQPWRAYWVYAYQPATLSLR